MNWTWNRMHVLAATSNPFKKQTTLSVAREAGVSRVSAFLALRAFERLGYVERERGPHNRAYWTVTTAALKSLYRAVRRRVKVNQTNFFGNPLKIIRLCHRAARELRGIGWRHWQIRLGLIRHSAKLILKKIFHAEQVACAENPGAYVYTCLLSRAGLSRRILGLARGAGLEKLEGGAEAARHFVTCSMKMCDPWKTAKRSINTVKSFVTVEGDGSLRTVDQAFYGLFASGAIG